MISRIQSPLQCFSLPVCLENVYRQAFVCIPPLTNLGHKKKVYTSEDTLVFEVFWYVMPILSSSSRLYWVVISCSMYHSQSMIPQLWHKYDFGNDQYFPMDLEMLQCPYDIIVHEKPISRHSHELQHIHMLPDSSFCSTLISLLDHWIILHFITGCTSWSLPATFTLDATVIVHSH